jgi:NADH:ubiquinone oxidoreductase subunit F (NADH-binding)
MTRLSVLAGPDLNSGIEHLGDHIARLGPLPRVGSDLIDALERSGMRGRGGAAFPTGTKWRTVAGNARGDAVVLANGAEGEPLSRKDRVLMETRPHLILDGAALAAEAVGAREVVLYLGAGHVRALDSLQRALAERSAGEWRRTRVVSAPARYVSGEETAAVHFVNHGVALPRSLPPRPFERGVDGRPTLVQNVETLAHAAMIARFGDAWFRQLGRGESTGTALLTVTGAVAAGGVIEVPQGTTIGDAVSAAGGLSGGAGAVLLGGYFGGWVAADRAWGLPVDSTALRARGVALGCGVVAVLPDNRCGVVETARILAYLADQSARQCGPCVFGLRSIAAALGRIAGGGAVADDLDRVRRWAGELPGRGACRHPDGAAALVASALRVFAGELDMHQRRGRCTVSRRSAAAVTQAA